MGRQDIRTQRIRHLLQQINNRRHATPIMGWPPTAIQRDARASCPKTDCRLPYFLLKWTPLKSRISPSLRLSESLTFIVVLGLVAGNAVFT
jgi:hypothetical protein